MISGAVSRPRAYRSTADAARGDAGRAIAIAAGGAAAFAPIEYALTLHSYTGAIGIASMVRLIALTATLALWLWLLLAIALSAVLVGARVIRAQVSPAIGRAAGWMAPPAARDGGVVRAGVPRLWAAVATALISGLVVQRVAVLAITRFKEPQLTAALIAAIAVGWIAVAAGLFRGLAALAALAAAGVAPVLRANNPLGRWRAAGVALAGLVGVCLAVAWYALPQSRSVLPVRLVISGLVIALGGGLGALWHARRERTPRNRRRALAGAAAALVVVTATLFRLGADLETKYVAITASPALGRLIGAIRIANDFDRDGFGSLLGEGDCAPFDRAIHPGASDAPDNGVDENCDGHDFSLRDVPHAPGDERQLPDRFRKDWNVLLLTIDTLRYDRTTFGGYATGPVRRNTTPRLAELVKRSVSFAFANAPSAGTMASIPAILTSKFFHSGIALDEAVPPGTPPRIMPENTTLPEIMKRKGYATGVIGSHVWWNDWGLQQGVDDYDNSIARTDDPFRVAADKVTDHVLAWVSRNQANRWFMWAHYIDPHGRYVAHPNVVDYGSSEPDLYDAEIQWTDREIGRLLDELARLPSYSNTIIVITSDHGDSMGEHSVPVGTHGTALYREMLHVPMIFYIPDNRGRIVEGAVTNLDIAPTIAALCGIDVSDLSFEGKSLVPQLFYDGTDDLERIVFAETNAPNKQRTAISARWKLIYYFATNLYELFDLASDPWEHANLAPSSPPAFATMKQALQGWMDRVMFARDPKFNQAYRQLADVQLAAAPSPAVTTPGQAIEGIEILGIDLAAGSRLAPGARADVHVYFRVAAPVGSAYRFSLAAWPVDQPASLIRTPMRPTADGAYGSDRWPQGSYVRERFRLTIPAGWRSEGASALRVAFGLSVVDASGGRPKPTGSVVEGDPFTASLGVLPLSPSPR